MAQQPASTTPLLQQGNIISTFLHQDVVVGVLSSSATAAATAAHPFSSSGATKTSIETVGVKGRLDAVDAMCNVTLANASSPALNNNNSATSSVAVMKGSGVMFIGVPTREMK